MNIIYQIKFYLQLNVCVSLSRERIDLVWLNVLVCVFAILYKDLELEFTLGLDPTRFRTWSGGDEHVFSGLDAQISDAERFRDATPFRVRCRHCQGQLPFALNEPDVSMCCVCTRSTLMISPQRHPFYLSQGLHARRALRQSALVAYKPN